MHFRHELKHRINLSDMLILRSRLSCVCRHDEHCEDDGTYFVRSLYFDDFNDSALREKADGVNRREKFRIRYYGNDTSFINLEKKTKVNGLCAKEKALITQDQCRSILYGKTDFLCESEEPLFRELHAKMQYKILRPKIIVAYRRESFVYAPGNVRVTLDFDIGSSTNVNKFLNPALPFVHLYNEAILEVKWDEFLPEIIRDAVQTRGRRSAAFSKYAASRLF